MGGWVRECVPLRCECVFECVSVCMSLCAVECECMHGCMCVGE